MMTKRIMCITANIFLETMRLKQQQQQQITTTICSSSNNRIAIAINCEGHPKSFWPRHIRQQYFPQSIHQWNVHPLLTHMSLLQIWRYC